MNGDPPANLEPSGVDQITARQRATPQERACPTCGGPVITKAQKEAEWLDYCAWVDRGTGSPSPPDDASD